MIEDKLTWGDDFDFSRHLSRYLIYEDHINQEDIYKSAMLVYQIKNHQLVSFISKRTLSFKHLEAKMLEFKINEELGNIRTIC